MIIRIPDWLLRKIIICPDCGKRVTVAAQIKEFERCRREVEDLEELLTESEAV